ncbi:MAG: queuine tRNA-ribosyltransferase, partial [Chloroflexota bacterium]|nr:queuine tRNA-ribosyltransferase [Chloroflexota bacterium]
RPGIQTIEALGGLHRFMAWDRPILTSFAPAFEPHLPTAEVSPPHGAAARNAARRAAQQPRVLRVADDGLIITSYVDGSSTALTPESAMEIQSRLGADVICALGPPASASAKRDAVQQTVQRARDWSDRAATVPIAAGTMRLAHLAFPAADRPEGPGVVPFNLPTITSSNAYDGYTFDCGMWGLDTDPARGVISAALPVGSLRQLSSQSGPFGFLSGVSRGMDLIDSNTPAYDARRAIAETADGPLDLLDVRLKDQRGPIESNCDCPACSEFTRAYIHSLFVAEELLGYRLATIHNVASMLRAVAMARAAIRRGDLFQTMREFNHRWSGGKPVESR